ncbi:zonular occludens toxin domain-containing protein [Lacrimispora amygdalina]|uniref:zonular occludens toxin domain-containing protein n=1 Tax=Lacrimispora amygdalina TaxID=253257 RepID=UPI0034604CC4
MFNCRSWNDRSRQQWANFFTQHRKHGYNIILISQFDRLINRQIRSLTEYEYRHRKINNFGAVGFFLGLFSLGHPLFISVEYWYGVKKKCGTSFFYGRKKYYRMYDSYKLFDEGTQGG